MKLDHLYEALLFVILILLQVLFFNQISLFGWATPFLYIYFFLKLPKDRNLFFVVITGFLMGLIIDVFLNTLGVNAAATTLIAAFRKPIMRLFFDKDVPDNFVAGIYNDSGAFIKFTTIVVFIHQTVLFGLESFSLFNPQILILRWLSSVALTVVLLFALDGFMHKTLTANE